MAINVEKLNVWYLQQHKDSIDLIVKELNITIGIKD